MNYERLLRRMRQRIFDYPPDKEEKASKVLLKIKAKYLKQIEPQILKHRLEREARFMRLME